MVKKTLFAAVCVAAMLSGCGGEEAPKAHQPVPIGAHDRCHLCGMVIVHYEGPKAQIFIKDVEEPLKFCSGRDAFTFALQPENARRLEVKEKIAGPCGNAGCIWGCVPEGSDGLSDG